MLNIFYIIFAPNYFMTFHSYCATYAFIVHCQKISVLMSERTSYSV